MLFEFLKMGLTNRIFSVMLNTGIRRKPSLHPPMKCRQCPEWFNLGDFFIFGILFAAKEESPAAKRGQKDGAFSAKTRLLSTQNAPRFAVNLLRKLPHVRAGAARVLAPTARCEKQKAPRKAGLFVFGRGRRTRTHDPWFWRPVLYQLSYTPIGPSVHTVL